MMLQSLLKRKTREAEALSDSSGSKPNTSGKEVVPDHVLFSKMGIKVNKGGNE